MDKRMGGWVGGWMEDVPGIRFLTLFDHGLVSLLLQGTKVGKLKYVVSPSICDWFVLLCSFQNELMDG